MKVWGVGGIVRLDEFEVVRPDLVVVGACKRSFKETCAKLGTGLLAGGGSVVGVVVAFEVGSGRVDEVAGGASTVIMLTNNIVLFFSGKVGYLVGLK